MPLPSAPPKPERRISSRRYYQGRIAVRLSSGHMFVAQGVNIGAGGMAFHCDENLAPDTRCQLHFSLLFPHGGSHTFTLRCVVVYTSLDGGGAGFKVAVQFEHPSLRARELLTDYIEGA